LKFWSPLPPLPETCAPFVFCGAGCCTQPDATTATSTVVSNKIFRIFRLQVKTLKAVKS
jgi:hypothetical protein